MKRTLAFLLFFWVSGATIALAALVAKDPASASGDDFWLQMKSVIGRHLGRPYVWGASGLKSYDCSGFVWRVLFESGVLIKRTTARKLYMSLTEVPEGKRLSSGNIVFFDNLKHCGIVADPRTFYHSESSIGTNLSKFDPYWRPKVCGYRLAPPPAAAAPSRPQPAPQ